LRKEQLCGVLRHRKVGHGEVAVLDTRRVSIRYSYLIGPYDLRRKERYHRDSDCNSRPTSPLTGRHGGRCGHFQGARCG
jgi:hypothetical protein